MLESTIVALSAEKPQDTQLTKECRFLPPSRCPLCHTSLQPREISGCYVTHNRLPDQFFLVCSCPNCEEVFLCEYNSSEESTLPSSVLKFQDPDILSPSLPDDSEFSQVIKDLSPMFVATYTQAAEAEAERFSHIAGPGYRKALEFLIKDFLILRNPDDKEVIAKESLGDAIARIPDEHTKVIAKRAAWIGNDETHYLRKHEDRDIDDLKLFIEVVHDYIKLELAYDDALTIPFIK